MSEEVFWESRVKGKRENETDSMDRTKSRWLVVTKRLENDQDVIGKGFFLLDTTCDVKLMSI